MVLILFSLQLKATQHLEDLDNVTVRRGLSDQGLMSTNRF